MSWKEECMNPLPCFIQWLDHLVLTVKSIEDTVAFYSKVLGMEVVTFKVTWGDRLILGLGKLELQFWASGWSLWISDRVSGAPPWSGDALKPCPYVSFQACGVIIEEGPVARTGAVGPITSVYFRDPDENLMEVSRYSTD
ncbi:Glyoxalase domain-containing protein 5, partial [Aptenodytes forsteri]